MILKKVFFVKNYESKSASNLTHDSALKPILHAQITTYKSFIFAIDLPRYELLYSRTQSKCQALIHANIHADNALKICL